MIEERAPTKRAPTKRAPTKRAPTRGAPTGGGWEVWRPRYLGLGVMRVRLVHEHMGKRVYLCVEVGGGEREMYLSEGSLEEWWEKV